MDADSQPERFYAGEFRHSIDEKNRITIPSRWRRDRPEDFILLPEATHQFLLVMSPKEFAKLVTAGKTKGRVPAANLPGSCVSGILRPHTEAPPRTGRSFWRAHFAEKCCCKTYSE